jgi:hypothetical protein
MVDKLRSILAVELMCSSIVSVQISLSRSSSVLAVRHRAFVRSLVTIDVLSSTLSVSFESVWIESTYLNSSLRANEDEPGRVCIEVRASRQLKEGHPEILWSRKSRGEAVPDHCCVFPGRLSLMSFQPGAGKASTKLARNTRLARCWRCCFAKDHEIRVYVLGNRRHYRGRVFCVIQMRVTRLRREWTRYC